MSDYVVSRKRKRHPVDPCLGFYLLSSGKVVSSPSPGSTDSSAFSFKSLATFTDFHEDALTPSSTVENKSGTKGICDASHNQHHEDLSDYGPWDQPTPECSRPMNSCDENLNPSNPGQLMVTVEDFLKRSNKRAGMIKKQYGKTKRRIKRLGDNGALVEVGREYNISGSDTGDPSQSIMQLRSKRIRPATTYDSSSDGDSSLNHEESSPLESKMKKARGRISKPLKERLYEAVVLTHGYPDDVLVHGSTSSSELAPTRRPLHFIPNTEHKPDDVRMGKRRPRTWSLVDPRKSMAIRTASFPSKLRPCLPHTVPPPGKVAKPSVQAPKRWKFADGSLNNPEPNRQPKIPAVKANKYPPLVFVSAEEDYKSIFSHDDNHKKSSRLPDVCTSALQMVSVAKTIPHVEGRISNQTVPTNNTQTAPLEDLIQRPNLRIETSAQVAVDQIGTLDSLNNVPSASLKSFPIINSISSILPVTPKSTQDRPTSSVRDRILGANVRKRTSLRRGSDVSPKAMRPLASFFDEFIENIRSIAVPQDQPPIPDKHLVYKRPLRKASRHECSPRIFVPQQVCTNDWESIRQNDPNYRDHMSRQRTEDLLNNQCLDPNIK